MEPVTVDKEPVVMGIATGKNLDPGIAHLAAVGYNLFVGSFKGVWECTEVSCGVGADASRSPVT